MTRDDAVRRSRHLDRKLETIDVRPRSVSELLEAMGRTGFQGRSLAGCVDILDRMIAEPANTIFLGYSGSMSTAGQWKLVQWLVENRFVDVLVSTGANVSEDLLEGLGHSYYQGDHRVDDAKLLEDRIDRYYDVYADELEYRKLERFVLEFMATLDGERPYSSAEFLHLFGRHQAERGIDSITSTAYRRGVPVFSPGMADSAYGVAAYLLAKERGSGVCLDQLRDFVQLGAVGEGNRHSSVVYLGGGVPKDTVQLVSVMADLGRGGGDPRPHRYAIQITTDSPQWGGLSGATLEEAVSWGKVQSSGERVMCYCDATIALPLIVHALLERSPERSDPPSFDWLFAELGR